MTFKSIMELAIVSKMPLHEAALSLELAENGNDTLYTQKRLSEFLRVILEESQKQYGKTHKTLTGMTGDCANKLSKKGPKFLSPFTYTAMVTALSITESNASMGRVVACPTAGASGVIPGIFYALYSINKMPFEKLLHAFIVASAVGNVIASKATLSGAAGGCQAEIGSAVAMAAAALTYISYGKPQMVDSAASLALKSILGLVCDPVGGYVEIPCVKRNATLITVAISCAELALSGIESFAPFDEMVTVMRKVGVSLSVDLRETGMGGVAGTKTAKDFIEKLKNKE